VRFGLALLALVLSTSSCLNFSYQRMVHLRAPEAQAVASLTPGRAQLQECLDQLGAPLIVKETSRGTAMAWGWFEAQAWNLSVSAPLGDNSGSISFESVDGRMRGLLLLFDRDWRLLELREGFLRNLGTDLERRRPQLIEE
jgi:hypothetical protein